MLSDMARFLVLIAAVVIGFIMSFYGLYSEELPNMFGDYGTALDTLLQVKH